MPFFTANTDVRTRYAIGQSIFTPSDLSNPNPPPTARPYAGFLYGAFRLVGDSGTQSSSVTQSVPTPTLPGRQCDWNQ